MLRTIALSLMIGFAWAGSALAQDTDLDSTSMTGIVAIGESIAEENCGRCHALGMDDISPHPDAPPFRVVAKRYKLEDLAEALAEGILTGHPDMPVISLEEQDIDAFLTYLGSLAPE